MPVPNEELPDIEEIRRLAKINLPAHYTIKDIRISYGSDPLGAPDDFDIIIEYESHLERDLRGSLPEIEQHQDWADALIQDIRSQWPPETVRISFIERTPKKAS